MQLLVLAMLRQLLAIGETRRLYRLLTEAADERRRLLADVMRSVDEDRHRVASQLHDQAIFSYVAFDSMTREAVNAERVPGATVLAGVSARLRDDLAEQAESLRHLTLAVRRLEARGAPSQARRLTSPIRAHVDILYGAAGAPRPHVDIDDDVRLDWTTETVVLRVVHEAIGNVRRHVGPARSRCRSASTTAHWPSRWSTTGSGSTRGQWPTSPASPRCGRSRHWPARR